MTKAVTLANLASGEALTIDEANDRVGIASTTPSASLDINETILIDVTAGVITATKFVGDGAGITGIAATDVVHTRALTVSGVSTFAGAVQANATTESTTKDTGALIVEGGVGIEKNLNLCTTIKMDSTAGVVTATTFKGALTGNASGTAGGLSGTPSVTVNLLTATDANVGGALTVGGVLTYEDVTNVDSVGIVTARQGVRVLAGGIQAVGLYTGFKASGVSTFAGGDILVDGSAVGVTSVTWDASADSLIFKDSSKTCYGDGGDLKVYHDGTHNRILTGANLYINNAAMSETLASFIPDGACTLHYNDSTKLQTTNTGIVVTGICTADTLVGRHPAVTTVTKSSQYTLADGDQGKMIITDSEVIVPENIFSAGDVFTVCNSSGSSINVTKGTGINLYTIGTSTNATVALAEKGIAVITCFAGNDFIVGGGGVG